MRKPVTAASVVALLAVLLGAMAAPATSAPVPVQQSAARSAYAPTAVPSLQQSLSLFQGLVSSVTTQPATLTRSEPRGMAVDPIGWALSAAGLAVSIADGVEEEQQLQAINAQLTAVQSTLSAIQVQLTTLQNSINQLMTQLKETNCATQTQAASSAAANIQSASQGFNELLAQTQAAGLTPPTQAAPTFAMLVTWATTYGGQIQSALNDLSLVISGTADDGALVACAQALYAPAPPPANFEATYYGNLYSFVSYWYQVQVGALNLYVEAQHLLALNASGQVTTLNPNTPQQVCQPPITNGQAQQNCNLAADMVSTVYDNLQAQLTTAGAPYLWGTGGQVMAQSPVATAASGQALAWLTDINTFQTSGCTLPLSSAPYTGVCGGSVGVGPTFANSTFGNYTFGPYSGWIPATSKAWYSTTSTSTTVMNHPSGPPDPPVAQAMSYAGLGNSTWGSGNGLSNLIILTGETSSSTGYSDWPLNQFGYQNSLTGQCLLDSNFQVSGNPTATGWQYPFCDAQGGEPLGNLVANFTQTGTKENTQLSWTQWPQGSFGYNYTDPLFYTASFGNTGEPNAKDPSPWWLNMPGGTTSPPVGPMWMTATYGWWVSGYSVVTEAPATFAGTPGYRWPVLPLSTSMCTNGMPLTNLGGAYTMCGADFQAWLGANLPSAPPAPTSPVELSATHSLGSANVSWRYRSVPQYRGDVTTKPAFRIRARRGAGKWTTVVPNTATSTGPVSHKGQRYGYLVKGLKAGNYSFKVAALAGKSPGRYSSVSRLEYVPDKVLQSRYYAFKGAGGTRSTVKAFADGRVYEITKSADGFGRLRARQITGHLFTNPYAWSGLWQQTTRGSWKNLRWVGYQRIGGPASSRKGMPYPRGYLPTY
ncbi:MAG: hypothetical protein WCP28_19915 [Actinomycetes bacterium]